jgi:phosphoribosylglycinamide formyltransferase-1
MRRVAFFISGTGGNAMNLFAACKEGRVNALPVHAVSSSASALGVERLRAVGMAVEVIQWGRFGSDEDYSQACFSCCEARGVDIICLCGFLKKLVVPDIWIGRILNIHPGPLPRFGGHGMFGHHVHEAVIAARVPVSGPTVHLVDNEYDHGEILAHQPVPVTPDDTPDSLQKRVYEVEMVIYPRALQDFINTLSQKGD